MSEAENGESLLDEKDEGSEKGRDVRVWLSKLELAKDAHKQFLEDGRKIVELYKNKVEDSESIPLLDEFSDIGQVRYNILWSTNRTLKPALYSRTPNVEAQRRLPKSDPVTLEGALLIERAISYFMSDYDFDYMMKGTVEDALLPGRGIAFARYEPRFSAEKKRVPLTDDEEVPDEYEEEKDEKGRFYMYAPLERESVVCDYIYWEDFLVSPAKRWDDVRWIAKRVRLSKQEFEERFPKINIKKVNFECKDDIDEKYDPLKYDILKHIVVWEIWNKPNRMVYWISPGYKEDVLEKKKDPLRLKTFFPCPRPLTATTSTDNVIPIANFSLWHQIARQLDNLTKREALLTEACKVVGAYDPSCLDLSGVFKSDDNEFKPATDWAAIQQAGGLKGVMDFIPLDQIVNALATVNQQKQVSLQDFYQLTGFSDVMQGVSNPSVSATAEENKSKYITLRLSEDQNEVQRFARDLLAITGEIIFTHVSDETLAAIGGYDLADPNSVQQFQAVMALLRDKLLTNYKISIETDSTISINENIEKSERTEFLNMASNLMGQMVGLAQQAPTFVPAAMDLLKFGARTFRQGKQIEASLDKAITDYQTALQQPPPPPPPDPKLIEVQQDGQLRTQEMQMNYQLRTQELQQKQTQNDSRLQLKMQQMQAQFQMEQQRAMAEMERERQKIQIEAEKLKLEAERIRLETEKARQELELKAGELQQRTVLDSEKIKTERAKLQQDGAIKQQEMKVEAVSKMADIATQKAEVALRKAEIAATVATAKIGAESKKMDTKKTE